MLLFLHILYHSSADSALLGDTLPFLLPQNRLLLDLELFQLHLFFSPLKLCQKLLLPQLSLPFHLFQTQFFVPKLHANFSELGGRLKLIVSLKKLCHHELLLLGLARLAVRGGRPCQDEFFSQSSLLLSQSLDILLQRSDISLCDFVLRLESCDFCLQANGTVFLCKELTVQFCFFIQKFL